jgi:hypothetical protein
MSDFLPALLWGWWILASLAGWGLLLGWAVRRGEPAEDAGADWLEAPAWGIAAGSVVGGLMNLAGVANRMGVTFFVFVGAALLGIFAALFFRSLGQRAGRPARLLRAKWLLLALPLLALGLCFASSVRVDSFYPEMDWAHGVYLNRQDDAQSYLVSPERMLQTGTLGRDPFNSRQMMSALGAEHFLNALALAVLPVDNLHLLEGGVGLAAACLAAAGLARRFGLGVPGAAALMTALLVVRPIYVNISSTATTVAVLIALGSALARALAPPETDSARRSWVLLAGLLLGAACSLKSTAIPAACIGVAGAALARAAQQRRWAPVGTGLLVGVVGLAAMTPWMIWQYGSSHTPLYPLLGLGGHVEAYWPSAPAPMNENARWQLEHGLVAPLVFLLITVFALLPRQSRENAGSAGGVALGWNLGWLAAWPAIALATEYADIARYLASARDAAMVATLAFLWRLGRRGGPRLAGPLLLALIAVYHEPDIKNYYFDYLPKDLRASIAKLPSWDALTNRLHAAQLSVPPGARLLVYMETPFLLDFTNNPICVADWPGEASPPPGLPLAQGGEAVAAYLIGQDIHYVIYDYRSQAKFDRQTFAVYLLPDYGRVMNRTTRESFAFQDDLNELERTRARVYDDGLTYVLDLDRRLPAPAK